jgi:hypothetical protein
MMIKMMTGTITGMDGGVRSMKKRKRYDYKSSSLPLRSVSRSSRTCWSATSRSPVNFIRCINVCETDDLQLVRHATENCNIERYRKYLKGIISYDLILIQIEKYQKKLKRNEIK